MNALPLLGLGATIFVASGFVIDHATTPAPEPAPAARTATTATAVKPVLTLEGARRVLDAAVADAKSKNGTAAIAVVDDGGLLLCLERLDGTFPWAPTVSIGKAKTAAVFRKPTSVFEKIVNDGRTSMTTLPEFTPLQGGVPIVVDGQVVGAVGVSGAASAAQDDEIATAAAGALGRAVAKDASASTAGAAYFESAAVSAAFAKGSVLFESPDGRFAIHASRRESAGQAEIHAGETDVIHVLDGRATLVTGGQVVGGRTTAPGETRGTGVEGGTSRPLAKGDVVVVPAGMPHWFQSVDGPFLYYVVKVRNQEVAR